MIESADKLASGTILQADLCIVGAGAAGLAMAVALAATRMRVIVLEAGGLKTDPWSDGLSRGTLAPECHHPPVHAYRRRRVGGSLSVWGGRCAPFTAQELAPRPWLGVTGWPLTEADLVPWWRAAHVLLELGAFDYAAATACPGGMAPMFGTLPDEIMSTDTIERFSRPTDLARAHLATFAQSGTITILTHCVATEMRLYGSLLAVREMRCRSRRGADIAVRAEAHVLAGGGLEVPRLLLASRSQIAAGVGNGHDQVGRCYMSHLAGVVGQFWPAPHGKVFRGYERAPGGVFCRRRLSLTPAAQARLSTTSVVARLHHPSPADPAHRSGALSAVYLGANLLPAEYRQRVRNSAPAGTWQHIANLLQDPAGTAGMARTYALGRLLAGRKFPSLIADPRHGPLTLDVHAEQLPNHASRVRLTRESDSVGMPRLEIDWRHTPGDIEGVRRSLAAMRHSLAATGCGTFTFDEERLPDDLLRHGAYGGHHLGTARMAGDSASGVVDATCRVHGMDNLFVASGAVFPTSGAANPTLTIVALALRLADHLTTWLRVPHGRQAAPDPGLARSSVARPFSSAATHVN